MSTPVGSVFRCTSALVDTLHHCTDAARGLGAVLRLQAETAEATLVNNIVYNIPRAAINFNDGFGVACASASRPALSRARWRGVHCAH